MDHKYSFTYRAGGYRYYNNYIDKVSGFGNGLQNLSQLVKEWDINTASGLKKVKDQVNIARSDLRRRFLAAIFRTYSLQKNSRAFTG